MKQKISIIKNRKIRNRHAKKTVNIMNVGLLMRKYAPGMNISPDAVKAMIDRFDMFLEMAMPQIARIAQSHDCKTVIKEKEDLEHPDRSQAHVTWFFTATQNKIEHLAIPKAKGYRWELVRTKKQKEE